jgi:hypothetical protein
MSFFPPLVPSARVYSPGIVPQSRTQSLSGIDVSFRRGNREIGQNLVLNFNNINETQLLTLQAHYIDRRGTFDMFFLVAETWSGLVRPPVPLLSDFIWRYFSPLEVVHASCGRFNVTIQLVAQPVASGSGTRDVVFDGRFASPTPLRRFIIQGGNAAATPEREFVVSPGGSA